MRRTTEYQANDGTRHTTAEECKRHEQDASIKLLVHMTGEQVKDALARTDLMLADAIEFAGKLIAEKRREDGDLRRKKKTAAAADVATTFRAKND